jgi:16S rRNA (uracil1498-N3)-methyltransferase
MRREIGDRLRLFDGENGEFLGAIQTLGKKDASVQLLEQLRPQPPLMRRVHLLFTPLAKNRMDMLIEKTVELGVTDFHPVLTQRTEHRKLNEQRVQAQILEACEQSERLHVPALHALVSLEAALRSWTQQPLASVLQWCCERPYTQRQPLGACTQAEQAFLVGPVGGFSDEECAYLSELDFVQPISLGENILRAETAGILCVSSAYMQGL